MPLIFVILLFSYGLTLIDPRKSAKRWLEIGHQGPRDILDRLGEYRCLALLNNTDKGNPRFEDRANNRLRGEGFSFPVF